MNDYLATVPFDLYQLHLFHLVVKHRSFTRAAEIAGLTQSAITRQMQTMETSLGVDLLERTTRSVRVSPAGEYLFAESIKLLGDVDSALQGYASSSRMPGEWSASACHVPSALRICPASSTRTFGANRTSAAA